MKSEYGMEKKTAGKNPPFLFWLRQIFFLFKVFSIFSIVHRHHLYVDFVADVHSFYQFIDGTWLRGSIRLSIEIEDYFGTTFSCYIEGGYQIAVGRDNYQSWYEVAIGHYIEGDVHVHTLLSMSVSLLVIYASSQNYIETFKIAEFIQKDCFFLAKSSLCVFSASGAS